MVSLMRWLSILSVNSLMLFNVGFPVLMLPSILNKGEVAAQTNPDAEAKKVFDEGMKLYEEGTAESRRGAIAKWEKALLLFRKTGNLRGEAVILTGIGSVYDLLGEKQKALNYYNQALPLYQQVGDRREEAVVLNNIGSVYDSLGEKQTALNYYNQALPLYQQVGDKGREATTLNNIGSVYNSLGEKQKALNYYNQALPLYQQVGDKGGEATTLNNIGFIYNELGEKQTALNYYQQALPLSQEVGDRRREATTLNNIGVVYNELGENQKALNYYNQALPLRLQVGDKGGEARTFNNIGLVYNELGEKQKALNYYQQALPLFQQVGDKGGEAITLNNIGSAYHSLGEKQTALNFYQQALPLYQQVGDKGREATTLNNIGSVYNSLGEKQKALNYYNQALPLSQQVGDKGGEATTLNNIGFVYNELGEKQTALNYYQQALPILQKVGDQRREAITLNNIGTVYDELGEKQTALNYYNQALPLRLQVGDKGGEATTLNNIGIVYDELGEKQTALNYYNQVLPLYKQVGDKGGEATTLNNIGSVYDDLGEKQKALNFYNQALPLYKQVGDKGGEATTLSNIAWLKRSQGKLTESLTFIEKSLEIIEDLRTKVDSAELRVSYFATVQTRYQFYINLLMQLHQQNPNQGYDSKAFHASERSRARTLLELLNEASVNIRQGIDPQLATEERKLQQQLNAIETQRIKLLSGEYTPEQKASIEQIRDKLIDEYDKLRDTIRTTSPNYAALTQPQPLTLKEVQQQVLDDDTLLLQYALGEESSYLWAVTKDSIHSYQLPPEAEIKNAAIELMLRITSPRERNDMTKVDSAADALTEILIEPVADKLNKKRLLIVADRFLQEIPFSALSIPNTDGESDGYQPLIVNYEIVNLPSATTIANIRNGTTSRKLAPKKVAIIADPVFSPEDSRLISVNSDQLSVISGKTTTASTSENRSRVFPLEAKQLDRAARDVGIKWDRLPATRTEAKAIMALIPESERTQAFDFQANREKATSQELGKYQIVHFATHGFANGKQPELSGVIMSLVDKNGNWQNGFLRLNDIFNLNLPAELVVLSACQTAKGKDIKGEGLVGLTRGFMYAGAKRVVGSLWVVDDVATADLMSQFYQGMLDQGLSPVEALRAAQLQMWEGGISPYYWGAFILQGEWE
ncbi:CHAT domain-containing tetratricopeptide repeat protein [Okeania sp. KiyG1]|uniref:CHAT domain-containing tetratricopeptide repeat protein n=1 Tax=Okeania sp. KiyG1 TaxID=2720165 RepID=UPI0019A84A2C|nr:CHAT domain-containing tetratricopeptide repeat protein [Okeania sp. KiyG1]GGA35808.1 tetratricopeptide repeat domain protein [Okeania sp. KiyG1]